MFGFLKQKIADFGNKLKQTAEKKEEEQKKEEVKEEKKHVEEKKENEQAKADKQEHKKEEKKEEAKEKKEPEEQKTTEKEKRHGLLGKLFGAGKKKEEKKGHKEKKLGKKEQEEKPHEKERGKTKEEIAAELEAKMFKEIQSELKEEGGEVSAAIEEEAQSIEEKAIEIKDQAEAIASVGGAKPEVLQREAKREEEKEPEEQKTTGKKKEESEETAKEEMKEKTKEIVLEGLEEEEDAEMLEIEEEEKRLAQEAREKTRDIYIKTLEEEKRELKAHVGVGGKLKGFIFGGVEISEKDINDLLWELELSLIESDVEQETARELVRKIKERLVGQKVNAKKMDEYLKEQIKEILSEMMKTEEINLIEEAKKCKKEKRPLKILMLGPNGAGKTTSIAKLVHYFKKHGLSSIVAAGDTFRAGAIDQIEEHAKKLGVRVIKQQYGADPAAVAFDAINAAEAGKINVVIIDSAGRQETNKNLMEELRKIERVAKPDLKIYVGEAYVGQALLEQVEEFKEIIGIDGFILTKIDTDAKGGTAISLLYKMKKPIIFVGTGQGYDDFLEFTPEFVLERII